MDVRLLTFLEFSNVHFYRVITLAILLPVCGLSLINLINTGQTDALLMSIGAFILMARFSVEWRRVRQSAPAFLHEDELIISRADGHRRIPLASIRSVRSRHSLFMVRRYRSWSDHLAFLQFTLNNGERLHTLAESAVLEFPAGKKSLSAIRAAVLAAKTRSLAVHQQNTLR
ncbi:hypothetical protein IB229_17540 [Pseudomonas sp. PDM14]|uniref:hypothetical protein n=1 Tax=Pseudomonas sp. PDM14 TaxID=2769288 RepID=UPI0017841125|nr:hypothetical protein [Pseudomonas sp. PDM14]MBD9484789.1 hypothetical protein [Pseudomonas sp. PDM14]